MTRYFEVLKRDGPARIGRLTLGKILETPCLISEKELVSAGSVWEFGSTKEAIEKAKTLSGEIGKLLIGPYVSAPLHAEPPISISQVPTDGPSGVVIHPLSHEKPPKADVYILGAAGSLRNPRELVRTILKVKNEIPPDTALYAPALATPANLALLIYLGADLVDATRVVVDGLLGRYHTRDGVWPQEELVELPCLCTHCRAQMEKERRDPKLTAAHNLLKLKEEIRVVRHAILRGELREYVERQVRVTPEQTTTLRLLDQEHDYLDRRTPITRRNVMFSNTADSLHRVEVTRFAERVLDRYSAPESDVLLLLPCSARKPYSKSRSHRLFAMALGKNRRRVHELILTSPLALVPRELEEVYPAAYYDVPVTGRWDLEERNWILSCLDDYLKKNKYARIVAHLDGELREFVEGHGIEAVYTSGGTNAESLRELTKAVDEAVQDARPLGDYRTLRFRAMADYYFGKGASDLLLAGDVKVKGRELQGGKKTLASATPNGTLALTIEGAKRLEPLERYQVQIGDFLPRGDVLSPGVTDADKEIRPGDEVLVRGEKAFGVGRARMSGWEMIESSRGVAVELRRIEKV